MQNEIAELPAKTRVRALPAAGFLFQLSHQAGLNIGRRISEDSGGFRP
jgi:hypothetical protein